MKKHILITCIIALVGINSFGQSKEHKEDYKKYLKLEDEVKKLVKESRGISSDFRKGFYCSNYFPEWDSYLNKMGGASKVYFKTIEETKNNIAFLEKLKIKYLKPNGAVDRVNSDYSRMQKLDDDIRKLEVEIFKYPYRNVPHIPGKITYACSDAINEIEKVIQQLQSQLVKEGARNSQKNNSSSSNTYNSSSQQTGNSNNSNSNNQETSAERLKRLDRERAKQIMQETEDNITRVQKSSDEIGNEVANMFQNGVTPEGFFNMGKSFSNLNSNTGTTAGLTSIGVGAIVGIVDGLNSNRDIDIAQHLRIVEGNNKERERLLKTIQELASKSKYDSMFTLHNEITKIEAQLIFSYNFLSRKYRDKKLRPEFGKFRDNTIKQMLERLRLFQELGTNIFIKNVIDNNLSNKEFINSYLDLSHSEYFKIMTDETPSRGKNNGKRWKVFKKTGILYLKLSTSNKVAFSVGNYYKKFSKNSSINRFNRYQKINSLFGDSKYKESLQILYFTEQSFGQNSLNCITNECDRENKYRLKTALDYYNNLNYDDQKYLIELILYKTLPVYSSNTVKLSTPKIYSKSHYEFSFIEAILSKPFQTNIHMAIQSPFSNKEISLNQAILEYLGKTNSNSNIKKLLKSKIKSDLSKTDKTDEQLFEEYKYLTQKQIESLD